MFHYINLKALFYCLGKNAGIGIQFQYIFGFMGMNDLQEVILYLIGISFFIKYFLFKKFLYICVQIDLSLNHLIRKWTTNAEV